MENVIKFLKESSTQIVNFIITSGLLISLVTHFFYKSNVKWRYKQIKLSDDVSKLLKSFIKIVVFLPVWMLVVSWMISESKVNQNIFFAAILIFIILLGIGLIFLYIKTTMKTYRIDNMSGIKKFTRVACRYVLVSLFIILITFFNLILDFAIVSIINNFESIQETFTETIVVGIVVYILNIYIIVSIYVLHSEGLVKRIKHMKIFYTQGQYINKDRYVKFEDFDIDKNYFSYLDSQKVKKVIPIKDLLRIEYVYKK